MSTRINLAFSLDHVPEFIRRTERVLIVTGETHAVLMKAPTEAKRLEIVADMWIQQERLNA